MYKKVGRLRAHVRKAHGPALRAQAPKVPPLEAWHLAALAANPPPPSHIGCVEWYRYEQSGNATAATEANGG